jgi:hypothetical protein
MPQCGWEEVRGSGDICAEPTTDENSLCDAHIAVARERRGIKVANWKRAEDRRIVEYFSIGIALRAALKAAVHTTLLAAESDDESIFGSSRVIAAVKNKRSKAMNYLSGSTKISRVKVAGWEQGEYTTTLLSEEMDGLSEKAANVFANEYNSVLAQHGLSDDVEAVVV